MSIPEPSGDSASVDVVAVVLVRDPSSLFEGLRALERQVYGPFEVMLVGGGSGTKALAAEEGVGWAASVSEALDQIPSEVTYVWFIDQRARALPDALGALVEEGKRVDASVAGSKILKADAPEELISVGMATDVFDVPYLGLEKGERDQAQYDVVRDVAAVPAISLLARRDLLKGLHGPDPELAPEAAGIDFSQRARLRGARVVVIPSSEVHYPQRTRVTVPWREEAGRIRAMLKSYSPLTLAWALPLRMLIGLIEAVVTPFLGRFTLGIWARAWAWNVYRFPSTVAARFDARRNRVGSDEELFRYQIRGSATLRELGTEIVERVQKRLPQVTGLGGIMDAGRSAVRSPGFLASAAGVTFALLATRSIWSGSLPAVGYALPPAEGASATLGAFAGGWNPAGLGSPEPLRPVVGAVAAVQSVLFDKAELTVAVLTVAALVAGAIGMARLLKGWGLTPIAAYAGGIMLIGGPATLAIGQHTDWPALLALGPLPWAIRAAVRPWPRSWRGRVGRIAAVGWTTGLAAVALPAVLVVPVAALAIWVPLGVGARWWAPLRAAIGMAVALPMLLPWLGIVDFYRYTESGQPAFWNPPWLLAGLAGVTVLAIVAAGDKALASVAGWGGVLAAGGGTLARLGDLNYGRDVESLGYVVAAIGSAALVAAAVESTQRFEFISSWRRGIASIGFVAALVLLASTVIVMIPGRAGLPSDEYRDSLAFTSVEGESAARVLMFGPADTLPGDSRLFEVTPYRVVSTPLPRLWEAHLADARLGDDELAAVIDSIATGQTARAGAALAPFGIKWVMFTGPTPMESLFGGQLDMAPLPGLTGSVFANEVDAARAVTAEGAAWSVVGTGYQGPAASAGRVWVAENADQRWGPGPWSQSGWANELPATSGSITFAGRPELHRQAVLAAAVFVLLFGLALVGTGRRAR
ncbi:MAG: hypothetical protein OEM94_03020 [Acidimicrobiia bacterium]|nr:hypothetical protein [Acidimicrobiia bacterium]